MIDIEIEVVRAIAAVKERNGCTPYDMYDEVYGGRGAEILRENLRLEARAAIDVVSKVIALTGRRPHWE